MAEDDGAADDAGAIALHLAEELALVAPDRERK
jgi:hypothetical protein